MISRRVKEERKTHKQIHTTSLLSDEDLDRVVSSSIAKVCHYSL